MSLERSPYKGTSGLQRIINATRYSIAGFKTAFHNEAAFRQLILLNAILILINFYLDISLVEHTLLLVIGLFALIVELFNSAIEAVVDRISLDQHELSKNAKDMGSCAQAIALVLIVAVWSIILIGRGIA